MISRAHATAQRRYLALGMQSGSMTCNDIAQSELRADFKFLGIVSVSILAPGSKSSFLCRSDTEDPPPRREALWHTPNIDFAGLRNFEPTT